MIDKISILTDFLDSQDFKDNMYNELRNRGYIIRSNQSIQIKITHKDLHSIFFVIYIDHYTPINVLLDLNNLERGIEFRNYVYKKIEEVITVTKKNEDFYNKTLKTLMEYNQNNMEENNMSKTINDTKFENFVKETEAKADASIAAYQAKVAQEIENKRKECEEANKKDKAQAEANELRYFYDGLINAGFTESEAMSILLKKI